MLVRCPNCRTTYKVSDEVLTGSSPVFRCSRCKHTFELNANNASSGPPTERPAGPVSQSTASPPDQELRLPFTAKPEAARAGSDWKEATDLQAEEKDRDPLTLESGEQWSLRHDDPPEQPVTNSETKREPGTPEDFSLTDRALPIANEQDKIESFHNILAISPYLEQRASILPFVTLFGLLVIGFSLLAVVSHANPTASEQVVKKIPLLGTSVLKNNHLKEGILIQSLRSGYQIIQGNREILLITGVALNRNPVVVREIQLTGRIYNQEGKELDRQTIWVGNTISPKIIRGMTIEDIPHLQNLKPLKSFEVPSGDSVPFTIVFLRSTKNAQDFTCEVVMAEGEV
jgi:predicted Zn finger-like uncharacterized protein